MPHRKPSATRLARAVDLADAWNATDADLAARLHPRYAQALDRAPEGPSVFRGLPFDLGRRTGGRRWLVLDRDVVIDLRPPALAPTRADVDQAEPARPLAAVPAAGPVSHLVVAHFSDSWRDAAGQRPAGMPVGWVLPIGEPLAAYELRFTDGSTRTITVRRRFELSDGIIGWGSLPFEAVSHRADETVDWRGPHPRLSPGRYAPTGHAGPLTILPGGWGTAQSGVADFVPSMDDDLTFWLHAIPVNAGEDLAGIRLAPLAAGRPGTDVVVAGLTLFHGTASPLVLEPRRQVLLDGAGPDLPGVDLGVRIRSLPVVRAPAASPGEGAPGNGAPGGGVSGWGRPRENERGTEEAAAPAVIDLATTADARLVIGSWEVPVAHLDRERTSPDGRVTIRPLPAADIRVDVRVSTDGEPAPARVRFISADGRYLPPLGHRDEVNPALVEDTGADIALGGDAYAYVPGAFQVDLPAGAVDVEVVKGFDHRPIRMRLDIGPETRTLDIPLERAIDLRSAGWRTSDSHVHFLSPTTALLQAAAEDVAFVHLLATQWGDHFTNTQDLPWGSQVDPTGRHAVIVGTENRQNLLGHLALLGARRPVLPMATGGAPEGRLGAPVTELLGDWADRCRAEGGLVVGAHFPLPYAEIAADIVTGRIDAVELQCFAPGLDNPSILEWYRFLNCGHRLPVLGGTDKMSAEVPVGAVRTYARLDPDGPPTFEAWSAAVRAGRTFATSGPVIELEVDGHEPGDVIALTARGGRLEARVRARAAQAVIASVELVVNGRVVARQDAAVAGGSASELRLDATVEVEGGAWIAARSLSRHEIHSGFNTSMASHTSPVYVEVADHPLFVAADAQEIAQVIEGTGRWLATMATIADPGTRARMVRRIEAAGSMLRERIREADRSD